MNKRKMKIICFVLLLSLWFKSANFLLFITKIITVIVFINDTNINSILFFLPNLIFHHFSKNIRPHLSWGQRHITKRNILVGFVCQTINWSLEAFNSNHRIYFGFSFFFQISAIDKWFKSVSLPHPQISPTFLSTNQSLYFVV